MEAVVKECGVLSKNVEFVFPKEEINSKYKEKLQDWAPKVNLPGYRKGKVSTNIIERKFKKDILEELTNDFIKQGVEHAYSELNSCGDIELGEINPVKLNDQFTFSLKSSVYPVEGVPEYQGLDVPLETKDVTDEEVDKDIQSYLKQLSNFEDISDDEEIKEDYMVSFHYDVIANGNVVATVGNASAPANLLVIRDVTLSDEDKKSMIGKKNKASFSIKGTATDKFENADLRGKEVEAKVTIDSGKKLSTPELSDDTAKQLGAKDINDLKKLVKDSLVSRNLNNAKNTQKEALLDKLCETAKFDLPELLLKATIENAKHDQFHKDHQDVHHHNHDHDEIAKTEVDEEKIKIDLRKNMILELIAKKENISASQDDISNYIYQMANTYRMKPADLIKNIPPEGFQQISQEITRQKALDLIAEKTVGAEKEKQEN